jgi:hypothetical protein
MENAIKFFPHVQGFHSTKFGRYKIISKDISHKFSLNPGGFLLGKILKNS